MENFEYKDAILDWMKNTSNFGIFTTDANLDITSWNKWLEVHTRLSSYDIIGKNILDLPENLIERKFAKFYEKALGGEVVILSRVFHKYLIALPPDPQYKKYFDKMQQTSQIAPLVCKDKVVGTITIIEDVTERIVKEMILKNEKNMAQHYLDIAGVIIIILDENGNIKLINKRGCEILGCKQQEVIGKNWFDCFIPENERETLKNVFRTIMSGDLEPYGEYENCIKTTKGEIRTIMWRNTVLKDKSGRIVGTLSSGEDITERKRLEEALKEMAITDELTGLYNRRGFLILSQQQLKLAARTGNSALLFFIDLDGMKWINDNLGHKEGDKALVKAARILKETFRESDIVGRIGGDEFAVLAVEAKQRFAQDIIARIRRSLKETNSQEQGLFQLSLSIGFSRFDPKSPKSLDELMEEADQAMYEEKNKKK